MAQYLFHFSLSNAPEISGVFREKRVIFDAPIKPTQNVDVTSSEDEKKLTLSQAVEDTKTALQSLKDDVNADKKLKTNESKKNDGIDTEKEKAALATFLASHKALDGLMGKISGDDNEKSLNEYQNYFSTGSIENMTQVEAVHKEIISLIQEDVKYKEAVQSLAAVKKEGKEKVTAVLMKELQKVLAKETWNLSDKIIILQSLGLTHGQIIKSNTFENLTLPKEITDFADKIEKIFTDEISEKSNPENSNKKLVFSDEEGLVFKTDSEISEMNKSPKPTEKKESVPEGSLDGEIQKIQKNRIEYKKIAQSKLKNGGFMVKILSYMGIDLTDPSQNNILYTTLRFIFNIPSPDETKNYTYSKNDKINRELIQPFLKQATRPLYTSFSATNSTEKAQNVLTGVTKLKGKSIPKNVSDMAHDIVGRIPGTKIISVTSGKMKVQLPKNSKGQIQMDALMKNSGWSMIGTVSKMFSGVTKEVTEKISTMDLGGLDMNDMLPNVSGANNGDIKQAEGIRKNLGYPTITGYSVGKGNIATIAFDSDATESDPKKSTIPPSVDVGSTTVLDPA